IRDRTVTGLQTCALPILTLAFLWRADMPINGIAGAQAEPADLRGRDIDVVRAGQIIRFRRAQETEAIGEHFDHAFADDVGLAHRSEERRVGREWSCRERA